MKKLAVPALLLVVLVIVLAYPSFVTAFVNITPADGIYLVAADNVKATTTESDSFWSILPLPVLIALGVIILIIIVLVVFLLMAPKKKKTGITEPDIKGKKSGKREEQKKISPQAKGTSAGISGTAPYEEFTPVATMPAQPGVQSRQAQPLQPRPLQPRPAVKPVATSQAPGAPQAAFKPLIQQSPAPQPMRPQPEQTVRPQPPKPQPVSAQTPSAVTPKMEQTPVAQRFTLQQQVKSAGINKPIFQLTNLNIMPNEVKEGDSVTISITVFNGGAVPGKYSVVFKIDNVVEHIAELQLSQGATQTTVCTVTKEEPGEYLVDVDGLRDTFTVLRRTPAAFEVADVTIKPEKVKQGQPVIVSFLVTNTGERPGTYSAALLIKGMTEATEDIYLEPGETKHVTFEVTKETAGFYPVSLEGHAGRFVVEMDWAE